MHLFVHVSSGLRVRYNSRCLSKLLQPGHRCVVLLEIMSEDGFDLGDVFEVFNVLGCSVILFSLFQGTASSAHPSADVYDLPP